MEDRQLPADAPVISEFLANNDHGLADSAGHYHDWIEIHNPSDLPINLAGYSLTDDPADPDKWTFPDTPLEGDGYLVVFASDENRSEAGQELHTNFKLEADGDYLALVAPDGQRVVFEYAPKFPPQKENVSYGIAGAVQQYFTNPTPGAPNDATSYIDLVQDTKFDHDRGFYYAPFELTITSATDGAEIRYTTDGSAPTATTGDVYAGPIPITTTTIIRAAAFKPGYLATNVDTQTYIFPFDVPDQPANPAGFPTTWRSVPADYEMDGYVVDNPTYAGEIVQDLLSIPTMSLVMDNTDLFGPGGIYVNPLEDGRDWERPGSLELINPDGTTQSFQIDAGVRIHGHVGRYPTATPKHSFRVTFREEYGNGKLKYPLFGENAADQFDSIVLRAGLNNTWTWQVPDERMRGQYIQDAWAAATQFAMGQPAPHGTFVHLYVNGLYWGLYNPVERPDASFMASYFGGTKDDYDVINGGDGSGIEVTDGDRTTWDQLQAFANGPGGAGNPTPDALASPEAYEQIKRLLDIDNFIDYMILNFYAGDVDWDMHNWYAARRREPGGTFKFFSWDAERILESTTADKTSLSNPGMPSRLFQQLRANAEFRLRFADRVQEHFFNDGALTASAARNRYASLAAQIEAAVVGESARWGDVRREPPYTRNIEWRNQRDYELNQYFPVRTQIVLDRFRQIGLFPSVAAPVFTQHGGTIGSGFSFSIVPQGLPVFYTLDGSDPRLAGGGISPTAPPYGGPIPLDRTTVVKTRTRSLDGTWSALTEATFEYDMSHLRITEIMYNPPPDPAGQYTAQDFEFVEVQNFGTDTLQMEGVHFSAGIDFTFPAMALAPQQRAVIVKNVGAFRSRYSDSIPIAGSYDLKNLNNPGDRITLLGPADEVIFDFHYDNWYALTDGAGYSLVAIDPLADPETYAAAANWRPGNLALGSPGTSDGAETMAIVSGSQVLTSDLSTAHPNLNLVVRGGAVILAAPQHLASLTLLDGAHVSLLPEAGVFLDTSGLAIEPGATLDMADGELVVRCDALSRDAMLKLLTSTIQSARNTKPLWSAAGITSTIAPAHETRGLAILPNQGDPRPIRDSFHGSPIDSNAILVGYALNGDMNLDGVVNFDDYFQINTGFLSNGGKTGYRNGDLNYDGLINFDDYFLINTAFLAQSSSNGPSAPAAARACLVRARKRIVRAARRMSVPR